MKRRMMKDLTTEERNVAFIKAYEEAISQGQAVIDDPKVGQWVKNIMGAEIVDMQEGIEELRA